MLMSARQKLEQAIFRGTEPFESYGGGFSVDYRIPQEPTWAGKFRVTIFCVPRIVIYSNDLNTALDQANEAILDDVIRRNAQLEQDTKENK